MLRGFGFAADGGAALTRRIGRGAFIKRPPLPSFFSLLLPPDPPLFCARWAQVGKRLLIERILTSKPSAGGQRQIIVKISDVSQISNAFPELVGSVPRKGLRLSGRSRLGPMYPITPRRERNVVVSSPYLIRFQGRRLLFADLPDASSETQIDADVAV